MYAHRYITEIEYVVVQKCPAGDERVVPIDQHDYLEWVEEGGVPIIEAAGRFLSVINGQLVIDPNKEQILLNEKKKSLIDAIQRRLDEEAQTHNYDGILSACTYALSTKTKFAKEGKACVAWRDEVWTKGYEIMAEVEAGTRPIPTEEELIQELPIMNWQG